jgi:hypothetical protein
MIRDKSNIAAPQRSPKIARVISTLGIAAISVTLVPLLLALTADNAWALQSHSAPEGIYVHQMAHLLFSGALGYLYWHTRHSPALVSRGWKYLQIFCILLICWNLLAFLGHETFEHLSANDFINKNTFRESLAPPITLAKVIYFISKMDHCLNVPALFALVISLRTFYREALEVQQ